MFDLIDFAMSDSLERQLQLAKLDLDLWHIDHANTSQSNPVARLEKTLLVAKIKSLEAHLRDLKKVSEKPCTSANDPRT